MPNPSSLTVRSTRRGACYEAAFSPDGRSVACVGRNVMLWETGRKRRLASAQPLSHPSNVAFSPSGHEVVVKNTSGECVVLDPTTLAILLHLGGSEFGEGSPLVFAADGAVIDGSWNGDLLGRDAKTGATIFHEHTGRKISQVAADPDRTVFAYSLGGSGKHEICIRSWPFSANKSVIVFEAPRGVDALALSDDRLAVVAGGELQIRSRHTGELIATREVPISGTGWSLAWWPNGARLVVAGAGRFALLSGDLDELWALEQRYACGVAISTDGSRALLAAWDESLIAEPD